MLSTTLSIGENAFGGCSSLEYVEFKNRTLNDISNMQNYMWGIDLTNT